MRSSCVASCFHPGNMNPVEARDNVIKNSFIYLGIQYKDPLNYLSTGTHSIYPCDVNTAGESSSHLNNPLQSSAAKNCNRDLGMILSRYVCVHSSYLMIKTDDDKTKCTKGDFKFIPTDDGYWLIQYLNKNSQSHYVYVESFCRGYLKVSSWSPKASGMFKLSPVKGENTYILTSKEYPNCYIGADYIKDGVYLSATYSWPMKTRSDSHVPLVWKIT